jgi:DNA-binding PadR family transcriptional regulator
VFDDFRSPRMGDRPTRRHERSRHHHQDDRGPGGFGGPVPHGRRYGRGPGLGLPGAPGWGRGRTARRGDVRAAIVTVLADGPAHGYQVIGELETRSWGRWRPSAGSIYPTLALLEDEGLVRSEQVEGRRVFSLTDEGRAETTRLAGMGRAPWDGPGDASDPMVELRSLVAQVAAASMQVAQIGSAESVDGAREILTDTRRRLYRLLADDETPTGSIADR